MDWACCQFEARASLAAGMEACTCAYAERQSSMFGRKNISSLGAFWKAVLMRSQLLQAAKGSRIWVPCAGQMRLLILQQYPASVCLVTGKAEDVSGIIITRYPRSLSIYGQNVAAAYAGTGCGTCWADLCIIFCHTKLNDCSRA